MTISRLFAPCVNFSEPFAKYTARASDGKRYLLIPRKSRKHASIDKVSIGFQYRRIDETGAIIPRIRQSKKQRLAIRRAAGFKGAFA